MAPPTCDDLIRALEGSLSPDSLVTDPDVMDAYRADHAAWVQAGWPAAVVLPSGVDEVSTTLRLASRFRVPVVPRGAGSGLSGGAAAIDGCIVLALGRMDRILEIDVENQLAVVEPGVLNADLAAAVAQAGLWYPPDPSSYEFSSIGGNLATNAGGLCCVKYGVTGDFVLGLDVVLADGSVVRTGRRTVKGVAGYDLTHLFVGSEGTLGVITQATLRLRPPREAPSTLVALFPTVDAAGQAVKEIIGLGRVPALLELMDRTTIAAVDEWKRMELDRDAAALLIAQSDTGRTGAEDIARFAASCDVAGASYVAETDDPEEGAALLAARRLAYPALERLGATLLDDVAVPRSRIPELLVSVEAIASRYDLVIGTFGHAGDGNFHPTIVFDRDVADARRRAQAAFDAIVAVALHLGGTITGEHGVGVLKRDWLARELGPAAVRVHRAVKAALDPDGILNPGKVVP